MTMVWPSIPLGEVLRQRPPDIPVHPTQRYQFAGVYSFGRGAFRAQSKLGSEISYRALTRLTAGEFVYPKLMAWEGAFAVVPPECDGCYVSPEFPVFTVDQRRLLPKWIELYFKVDAHWQAISGGSIGTNVRRRRLYPEDLLANAIPVPPLDEQRRVLARVQELAAKVEEARSLRKQSAGETTKLLIAMAHRTDMSDEDKERAAWRRVRLSDVISEFCDPHPVRGDFSYPNLGIYSYGRGLFRKQPISGLQTSAQRLFRARSGLFIYSRLFAFEGAYGVVDKEFDGYFVSNEYPMFVCDDAQILPNFLGMYFRSSNVWKKVAEGSLGLGDRRQRVQPVQLLHHEIFLPPMAWQHKIAKVQRSMTPAIALQLETAVELEAMLLAILDKVFKGEL